MRKSSNQQSRILLVCVLTCSIAGCIRAIAADAPGPSYNALSSTLLERAENEVTRIQALVEEGTLPKTQLEAAKARLADAQDDVILSQTLYGPVSVQNMTAEQATAMLEAAQRRLDRQAKIVEERRSMLDNGILARSEFAAFEDELSARKRVLELARSRSNLLSELRQMADTEQRLARAIQTNQASKDVMIRYDGSGLFALSDLPAISSEFEKRFHRPLPVSAMGQTVLHQAMGLDHRNRVDVALNPDQPEGLWLRGFLESQHVPYLAFRNAVVGAATAPHIHIGTGSMHLKLAQR